jgi:hypothetical protein
VRGWNETRVSGFVWDNRRLLLGTWTVIFVDVDNLTVMCCPNRAGVSEYGTDL